MFFIDYLKIAGILVISQPIGILIEKYTGNKQLATVTFVAATLLLLVPFGYVKIIKVKNPN